MFKLKYKNDWEADKYYITGFLVKDLTKVEIDNTEYKVISKVISVPYDDMGHSYEGVSKHYFIRSKEFGVLVDLNEIIKKKTIIPLRYTLDEEDVVENKSYIVKK